MIRKKKVEKEKLDLQVKEAVCFSKANLSPEEQGYSVHFVPSGYKGIWIKVCEYYDYTFGIEYASSEENEILNKQKGNKK
ncbi:MAG: hypothetical protein MUP27_09025 [Desulfobacterales bacterium]|nr:hypothetical protein [Desulfobacterales bacterium]